MEIYLAAAPDRLPEAQQYRVKLAHAAYRVGKDSQLTGIPLPASVHGGLMLLSDGEAPPVGQPEQLCRAIWQECRRRNASGVVLDFTAPPSAPTVRFVRLLEEQLLSHGLSVFVPESWAGCTRQAAVLICTALSGGTLRRRLEQAAAALAPRPIALDCQRLMMDFLLPSPNGEGAPLTLTELERLRQGRTSYFSAALCARYFTYHTDKCTHFVLYDDADTLRRKLRLAEELGAGAAFFMLPEVADIAGELFVKKNDKSHLT